MVDFHIFLKLSESHALCIHPFQSWQGIHSSDSSLISIPMWVCTSNLTQFPNPPQLPDTWHCALSGRHNLLPRSCLRLLVLLELSGTTSRAALSSSGCFYSHNEYSTRLEQGLCPPLPTPYSISKLLFLPITKFPHGTCVIRLPHSPVLVAIIYLLLAPILMS